MEVGKTYIFRGYRQSDGSLQRGEAEHEEFNKPVVCTGLVNSEMGFFRFPHSGRSSHLKANEIGELPSKPLEDWM